MAPCFSCAYNAFDDSTLQYLGVEIFKSNDTLFGWIKIQVIGSSHIKILEYACNSNTLGIHEIQSPSINVFPNPVSDKLNITINRNTESEIIIYDMVSRSILRQQFYQSTTLHTENLSPGIYIYEVRNGIFSTQGKFIKK